MEPDGGKSRIKPGTMTPQDHSAEKIRRHLAFLILGILGYFVYGLLVELLVNPEGLYMTAAFLQLLSFFPVWLLVAIAFKLQRWMAYGILVVWAANFLYIVFVYFQWKGALIPPRSDGFGLAYWSEALGSPFLPMALFKALFSLPT
jgi:hypothetical protein